MLKKILLSFIVIISLFIITGCRPTESPPTTKEPLTTTTTTKGVKDTVKVIIDNKVYTLELEDNETANSFKNLLPQEYKMTELNGNEKYIYLDTKLPTNSKNPKYINAGDVMLYGNNCLVVFYKSFDTSFSYTKIGHIDNLDDLGSSNITIKFEQ